MLGVDTVSMKSNRFFETAVCRPVRSVSGVAVFRSNC